MFAAIVVPLILNLLLDMDINEQVVIDSTDAPNYAAWQTNIPTSPGEDPPITINYKLYFFDTQNPSEVLLGAKPTVLQKGPYSFLEWYNKFDVKFSDHGDTVMYQNQKYYTFNQEGTAPGLSLGDRLVLPYPTVLGFEYLLNQLNETTQVPGKDLTVEQLADAYVLLKFEELIVKTEEQRVLCSVNPRCNNNDEDYTNIIDELRVLRSHTIDFLAKAPPTTTLLKSLMCNQDHNDGVSFNSSMGVSPFFDIDPVQAYFGWTADPILVEMNKLLAYIEVQPNISAATGSNTSLTSTWSIAVPGAAVNYTTEAFTSKMKSPVVQKTGLKNPKEIALYVSYNNMTTQYICIAPLGSGNKTGQVPPYNKGTDFAACPHFQLGWNKSMAESQGYTLAFATDFANRIDGCDGNQYGRPLRSDKIILYVSDIYRTVFIQHTSNEDWHGVSLRRYRLQQKDLYNATMNPNAAQYYQFGPNGMENLTAAVGFPSWVSKPQFLDGDAKLVEAIEGLSPNINDHDSYLDMEPMTGLFARAAKRLQLNYVLYDWYAPNISTDAAIDLSKICEDPVVTGADDPTYLKKCQLMVKMFECLSIPSTWTFENGEVYYPYAWAEESFELSADDAQGIRDSLYLFRNASEQTGIWCIALSSAFILAVIVVVCVDRSPLERALDIAQRPSADVKLHENLIVESENKSEDDFWDDENNETSSPFSFK